MRTRPTIAMMITQFDGWYQGQLWHGAVAAARLHRVRLVGLVGNQVGLPESDGSEVIYRLAMRGEIDGYLPSVGTVGNSIGLEAFASWFSLFPARPTVCIGSSLPGFDAVIPDGRGMEQAVAHLIETHGCKRIAFLAGPERNADAQRRLNDYRDALLAHGIAYDPTLIETANFDADLAESATRRIFERAGGIDAIVAANDGMAVGAYRVLTERKIQVPNQMKVIGYDNIDECRAMTPSLSTVHANTFHVAFRATERLIAKLGGQALPPSPEIVSMELVIRKSCGCIKGAATSILPNIAAEALIESTTQHLIRMISNLEDTDQALGDFQIAIQDSTESELASWELSFHSASLFARSNTPPSDRAVLEERLDQFRDLLKDRREALQHRLRMQMGFMMHDLQVVYKMIFSNLEPHGFLLRVAEALSMWRNCRFRMLFYNEDLSPICAPDLASRSFKICLEVNEKTIRHCGRDEGVFPSDDPEAGVWSCHSLNQQDQHYGILQVRDWTGGEEAVMNLNVMLAAAMDGRGRFASEMRLKEDLHRLSQHDEMTGVLNRRGLLTSGQVLANLAARDGASLALVLCDLDGLKEINDRYGHSDGDLAIRALAESLVATFRKSDVVARLGGDEFAVVTLLSNQDDSLAPTIERLHLELTKRGELHGRPWLPKTSAGWSLWNPTDGRTLEEALSAADANLYTDKRNRKQQAYTP